MFELNPVQSLLLAGAFIGTAGGFLSGLIGVGAGLISVPLLLFLFGGLLQVDSAVAMHCAIATTMLGLFCNSIASVSAHLRRGNVRGDVVKAMAIFCMVGAIFGVLTASRVQGYWLTLAFGLLMAAIALRMIVQALWPGPARGAHAIASFHWSETLVGGLGIGYYTGLFGLANVLLVPFISRKSTIHQAVASGMMLSTVMFPVAIISYMVAGWQNSHLQSPYFLGYVHWPTALAIGLPAMLSGPLGVRLSAKAPQRAMRGLFGGMSLVIAAKILLEL